MSSSVSEVSPLSEIAPQSHTHFHQFDFLRASEMAAISCFSWIGKGNKEAADAAACDAIRRTFEAMDVRGEVVIGEGIKDKAPGLFAGERFGTWREGAPRLDIAIDPLDGTTNVSKGLPNAISCIAVAARSDEDTPALQYIPAFYMKKLAYPRAVRQAWIKNDSLPLDIDAPLAEVIGLTARILNKSVRDTVVMVLDRPRHAEIIEEIRSVGASLRTISDGDISAALAPAMPRSGIDLYVGIGGAPEGILSAVGLRCMGGGMQAQMWPRDDAERRSLIECGWSGHVEKVYRSRDLVRSDDVLFIAAGVSDSPLLSGVRLQGNTAITHSIVIQLRSGAIRYVKTEHDLRRRSFASLANGTMSSPNVGEDATPPANGLSPAVGRWRQARQETKPKEGAPPAILLMGPPGSGKGTIGKALGRLPGFLHCSSGDLIRSAIADSGDGERWEAVIKGGLVSDADLWKLFDAYLSRDVAGKVHRNELRFLILDGIPHCRTQVPDLSTRIDVRGIVLLNCPRDVLRERLIRRGRIESRMDDTDLQVVESRLRLFDEETLPVLDAYPANLIHHVDAAQQPPKVLFDVLAIIDVI